jgi:malate dehydrogenase (oxaloacetate-decarboxylating)(NADP+)
MDEDFRKAALDYHRGPRPGKLAVEPTKRMASQRDLPLACSPGVAACEAIALAALQVQASGPGQG